MTEHWPTCPGCETVRGHGHTPGCPLENAPKVGQGWPGYGGTVTYVRESEAPRADGSCLTADLATDRPIDAAGWYVEFDGGMGPHGCRTFIPFLPQWEHDPQRDGAGCSWCGRFAQVNADNLCRECFADDDSEGGYVTAATLWVLCAVVALATILASYVGDSFAAMRDAGATATSDTEEVRAEAGGVHCPLGHERFTAREFCSRVRFAMDALRVASDA